MLNRSVIHQGGGLRGALFRRHRQMQFAMRQRAPRPPHGLTVATHAETLVYRRYALVALVLGTGV